MFLYIDLPRFDFPVIFNEPEARSIPSTSSIGPSTSNAPTAPPISSSFAADVHLWSIVDPEIARENPVEDKHRRLVRSHRSSPYDRELKPNAKIRDELGVCLQLFKYFPTPVADSFSCRRFSITPQVSRSTQKKRISSGSSASIWREISEG